MFWHPGHVAKAKKRIRELVKAVNYVLELRDARAPYATGAYEREKLFKGKKSIIVLTKTDLADPVVTDEWIAYYKERGERVVTCQKGERGRTLLKKIFGERTVARALVVGLPNVGKSTFINKLKGRRSLKVGAVPGVTRGVQWIQINDRIKIVDTPGIVYTELFSKNLTAKLILTGCLPIELVDDWEILEMAFSIVYGKYPGAIRDLTGEVKSFDEFLMIYGKLRGFLIKGGEIDKEKAKNAFFFELSTGKFGRMSFEKSSEVF